jgi:uroporphyrinogen III methyltransferase/synthase
MIDKIRIGTRKSLLAQAQTRIAAQKLRAAAPEIEIELLPIVTEGDLRLDKTLGSFGGKGIFTKELEQALLEGKIHMAVHSAKDMPTEFPEGLTIGAVVERAEVEDMIVSCDGRRLCEMAPGTVIGTGSLRRGLQLKRLNSGIVTKEIRGNVQTRLRKLADGEYDAIVLARAGLERLRRDNAEDMLYDRFRYEILNCHEFLPAAGQGILAVEVSKEALKDREFAELCRKLNSKAAECQLLSERSFLKYIGGGCNAPAAAYSWIQGERLFMEGAFAGNGETMQFARIQGAAADGERLGKKLAEMLLVQKCS